jgi:hypothetical protein
MQTPYPSAFGQVRSASYSRLTAAAGMSRSFGRRLLARAAQAGQSRALQCSILAFDIAAFGDRRRDDDVQLYVRAALYRVLEDAFEKAGIPWRSCHREDRGDGVLVVVPAHVSIELLVTPLADQVRAGLRRLA